MSDPTHPIWSLLRIVVVSISLTITLYFNASHFDSTELWTIGTIFVVLATGESLTYFMSHFSVTPKEKPKQ